MFFGFRDRAKIRTSAELFHRSQHSQCHIRVKIVNYGRIAVVLSKFGGDLIDGGGSGTYISEDKKGIRLGEQEIYEKDICEEELYHMGLSPEGNKIRYLNFWFENRLGQRYKIKNSEKLIKELIKQTGSRPCPPQIKINRQ